MKKYMRLLNYINKDQKPCSFLVLADHATGIDYKAKIETFYKGLTLVSANDYPVLNKTVDQQNLEADSFANYMDAKFISCNDLYTL